MIRPIICKRMILRRLPARERGPAPCFPMDRGGGTFESEGRSRPMCARKIIPIFKQARHDPGYIKWSLERATVTTFIGHRFVSPAR